MSSVWSKKWVVVLAHTAAWLLLFSLPFLLRPSMNENRPAADNHRSGVYMLQYILTDLIYVGFFYLNALMLVPRFIYRRKYK